MVNGTDFSCSADLKVNVWTDYTCRGGESEHANFVSVSVVIHLQNQFFRSSRWCCNYFIDSPQLLFAVSNNLAIESNAVETAIHYFVGHQISLGIS